VTAARLGPVAVVGGAGRTGKLVVRRLLDLGAEVRVVSRRASRAHDLARDGSTLFDGDIRDGSGLADALRAAGAVVFSIEPGTSDSGPDRPETTMYQGVRNVLAAASSASRFVLLSQIYVTRPDNPMNQYGRLLDWRLRGEDAVRASGMRHTVIRPGWLTGGTSGVRLEQGDTGDGQVARTDVAEACVQALLLDSAADTTFEIYNERGKPPSNWDPLFRTLAKDSALVNGGRTA
jgi:uncharacterized protein YbjT (DUF2867 family)